MMMILYWKLQQRKIPGFIPGKGQFSSSQWGFCCFEALAVAIQKSTAKQLSILSVVPLQSYYINILVVFNILS